MTECHEKRVGSAVDAKRWIFRQNYRDPEEAQVVILAMEANTEALAEDAEPALREIALNGMGDTDTTAGAMIPWCQENTEAINPTSPW